MFLKRRVLLVAANALSDTTPLRSNYATKFLLSTWRQSTLERTKRIKQDQDQDVAALAFSFSLIQYLGLLNCDWWGSELLTPDCFYSFTLDFHLFPTLLYTKL